MPNKTDMENKVSKHVLKTRCQTKESNSNIGTGDNFQVFNGLIHPKYYYFWLGHMSLIGT
jgi:hypothetical protein